MTMYYHTPSNSYIESGSGFLIPTPGGVMQYPANWLSKQSVFELQSLGIVEVTTTGTPGDPKYFNVTTHYNNGVRTFQNVPKHPSVIEQMHLEECELAKTQIRSVREAMLNRLAGIALRAQMDGDTVTVNAYRVAVTKLLDLTTDLPTDPRLIESFISTRYSAIALEAALASPALAKAFADVDI